MKMRNFITVILGFIFYYILYGIIYPWGNVYAHPTFNEMIIKFLELNSEKYFPSQYSLYFSQDALKYRGLAVTNPGFFERWTGESEVDYTVFEWIKHGGFSADEPEIPASVRHFYDPIMLSGSKYLTNRGTFIEPYYPNPQINAIDWAIGDNPKGDENNWTLLKGKQFLKIALESPDEDTKKENVAKAFRCLGEVLHNTGDMGCPPHTRNDSHAAPLGYTFGFIFGSPDPTEELLNVNSIAIYMDADPDPSLKSFCENATTIRSINEKLAEYTNANLFTTQTINGIGGSLIKPINNDGNYPKPLVNDLEYDSDDYSYYKVFPNQYKIKMLKDRSYFVFRGYPYIDKECVSSQANVLVPNIICAGANVIRLFIPKFQVTVSSVSLEGEIKGMVKHLQTSEYNTVIQYSGKIEIYNSSSSTKIGTLDCSAENFNGTLSSLKTDDEIYAVIPFPGINIRSNVFKVGSINYNIVGCSIALRNLTADFKLAYPNGYSETVKDASLSMGFPKDDPNASISFSNGTLIQEYANYQHTDGQFYTEKITINFDETMENIKSLTACWKSTGNHGTYENKISALNISRDKTVSSLRYRFSGSNLCDASKIASLYKFEDYGSYTYSLINQTWKCNTNSELVVYISTQ
jgi:hypothetical protein